LAKINQLKKIFFFISCYLVLASFQNLLAQAPKKIIIENSDYFDVNQIEAPDATLLTGNVRVNHDGIIMTCNKAYYFQKENYIKAFGNVQLVQGDTLFLNSKYAEYNGDMKIAFATGDAKMLTP
jgi:lipopolysaccharide assembly outer membrane protein LptD (OstA)